MIATAVVLFTACSENDTFKTAVQEQQTEQALTFSAFANKVTKAGNSAELNDFYTVFGVYGWKTVNKIDGSGTEDSPVFSNEPNEYFKKDSAGVIVYNDANEKPSDEWAVTTPYTAAWYYENVRYWDKMATSYQFFAIAPYDSLPTYSVDAGDDNISIASAAAKYDISTEKNLAMAVDSLPQAELAYAGFNKDYMIANKRTVAPSGNVTTEDLQLVFNHILSKLNVKIKKSDKYYGKQILQVNKLKIANLAKKGYFVYDTDMTTNGWTTSEKYDIDIDSVYALANDTVANYDNRYWIETLIFPQETTCKAKGSQPTATALTDLYLYIQYQIGTEVYNAYFDLAYVFNSNLEVNDTYEFEQGSQYNLTLIVGPEPIHFDAEVIEWTPKNAEDLAIN